MRQCDLRVGSEHTPPLAGTRAAKRTRGSILFLVPFEEPGGSPDGVATETAPMHLRLGSTRRSRRVRGAVAWKLLAGIAAGVAVVWFAAQPSVQMPEPASRAVAGPIGVRAPVTPTESRPAAAPPQAIAAPVTQADPFAGVDVSNNSVLRHIAGIEEKSRARPAPPARETPRTAAAPSPSPAPRVAAAPPPVPVRDEPVVQAPSPAAPPPVVLQVAAAPTVVEAPRVAAAAPQPTEAAPLTRSVAEPPVTLPPAPQPIESPAKTVAPPPTSSSAASTDRVLVAALGKSAPPPPPSVVPPLRVSKRTVPVFPIEAVRDGVQTGRVVARLTIESDGRVSAMQILSATPIGYFERESRRALATWRYEPPGEVTFADVELVFNRE